MGIVYNGGLQKLRIADWQALFLENVIEMNPDEIKSPKSVFRACVSLRICSIAEGEILIRMADDRNITSHCYDIQQVRQILPDIEEYHTCMSHIIKTIESQNKTL